MKLLILVNVPKSSLEDVQPEAEESERLSRIPEDGAVVEFSHQSPVTGHASPVAGPKSFNVRRAGIEVVETAPWAWKPVHKGRKDGQSRKPVGQSDRKGEASVDDAGKILEQLREHSRLKSSD
ncbi:MAG: hypothetical protein SGCHY_003123 [Lobulomycetales sp.]